MYVFKRNALNATFPAVANSIIIGFIVGKVVRAMPFVYF